MTKQEFLILLQGFRQQTLTNEQLDLFFQEAGNPAFRELIGDEVISNLEKKSFASVGNQVREDKVWMQINPSASRIQTPAHRVHFLKTAWVRYAAAVIIILGSVSAYLRITSTKHTDPVATVQSVPVKKDIAAPDKNRATITLAGGKVIYIDSTLNGTLATQGAVNVIKTEDGQIAYQGTSNDISNNTLSNPRGSKVISLTLADGSKVWLNAASSLTYPTAFVGKERKVQVTGEAYFEVAHNAAMPFIVDNGKTSVQVLGTHFNVNAYDDESSVNVTLLEGSVSLTTINKQRPTLIKPGEQASIDENGRIQLSDQVNIQEVMAWKNGIFSFNNVDIETIMRQISRWYDVDVVFEKPVKEKFYAEAPRNVSVSVLLKMLEATKAVHFKIEGKTISVMP